MPDPGDVQQVVFYATVLGCRDACLVYPRAVPSLGFSAGQVNVKTVGIDLSRPSDARPVLAPALAFMGSADPPA